MNIHQRRLGRLSAATAVGAVVTSGLLLAAPAAQAVNVHFVRGDQVDLSETRTKGHNDFTDNGVHITTDAPADSQSKAAGYFDVDLDLADVGEPSMLWTQIAGTTAPGLQLRVDFDDDGNIDATLVGEAVYGNVWWVPDNASTDQFVKDSAPGGATGGTGSAYDGTLNEWRALFPNARVFTAGWSLGSGIAGEGTLGRITLGDDRYFFQPAGAPVAKTVYKSEVDTQYTRSKGHNTFLAGGGIQVTTDAPADSQSKAAGYFATNIPLKDSGAFSGLDFTLNSGFAPGLQLVTDFDGDGTADGTLVSEAGWPGIYWLASTKLDGTPVALWLKDLAPRKPGAAEPAVPGYSAGGGTPAEWRVVFQDATIVRAGYSLGSGAVGDGVLTKIKVGLNEFSFAANRAPVASNLAATTPAGTSVQVTLAATDPDGDSLTYSSTDATVVGNKLTYTAPKDFTGAKVLAYQVTDSNGASTNGTVTVTVTKASSTTTLTVAPGKITTKSRHIRGKVTVTSTGALTGGTVDLYDGDTKIGTGVLDATGHVKIAVTETLSKGKHTVRAVFAGTPSTATSQASVIVKVKNKK